MNRIVQLSSVQAFVKRLFDLLFGLLGLMLTWWIIGIAWVIASYDTHSNGFFLQTRVGRNAKPFVVIKIKTMRPVEGMATTVTSDGDPRITDFGSFFRKSKIDELPQLINVVLGDMSFVGPRPDVPGFADKLKGESKAILTIRPGITGPATLKYRIEEELLASKKDPEQYNREVIWPDKVRINLEYIKNWSLMGDIKYIVQTVIK